jgi:hypothetical protein
LDGHAVGGQREKDHQGDRGGQAHGQVSQVLLGEKRLAVCGT